MSDGNGEFTTSEEFAEAAGLTVLDKPAVGDWGRDLPTKYHVTLSELRRKSKAELEADAAESGIDLGEASTKEDIVAVIAADTKEK